MKTVDKCKIKIKNVETIIWSVKNVKFIDSIKILKNYLEDVETIVGLIENIEIDYCWINQSKCLFFCWNHSYIFFGRLFYEPN